jgi:hypothetical protein
MSSPNSDPRVISGRGSVTGAIANFPGGRVTNGAIIPHSEDRLAFFNRVSMPAGERSSRGAISSSMNPSLNIRFLSLSSFFHARFDLPSTSLKPGIFLSCAILFKASASTAEAQALTVATLAKIFPSSVSLKLSAKFFACCLEAISCERFAGTGSETEVTVFSSNSFSTFDVFFNGITDFLNKLH